MACAWRCAAVVLVTVSMAGVRSAAGQRTWLDATVSSGVSAVATLGVFDDEVTGFPVGTLALRGRHAIGAGLVLTGELPLAHARTASGLRGSSVGSPWIGLEHQRGPTRYELGARIALWSPGTQESALAHAYAQQLDFDRWEAWFFKSSAVRAAAQVGVVPTSGSFASAKLGLTGIVVEGSGGDGELLADYQVRAGLAGATAYAWVGVIGHGVVTSTEGSVGDRTIHQLELGARTRGRDRVWEVAVRRYVGESFGSSVPLILRAGVTIR